MMCRQSKFAKLLHSQTIHTLTQKLMDGCLGQALLLAGRYWSDAVLKL